MISDFHLSNYGPVIDAQGKSLSNINLILGKNSTGKTFLLKALYTAIRSHEEANRGQTTRDFSDILSERLFWTFQVEKIGEIVTKGDKKRLKSAITLSDNSSLLFEFTGETTKKVTPSLYNLTQRQANSIFLPPKEVLSLTDVIHKSLNIDRLFGFDQTYGDLVEALRIPTQQGRNSDAFVKSRKNLETMFDGKVEFDTRINQWVYRKGKSRYSIMTAAEGVKKVAILDTLLGNRYLNHKSIVFIDEPESALHPTAIVQLLEIISVLAEAGIQFFLATHSYYVIKKLLLIAKQKSVPIATFMAADNGIWQQSCLLEDGLPDNEIINESIRLFEAEYEGDYREGL